MEAKVYNHQGKEVKTIEVPSEVFGLRWNGDLVHQVVSSMMSNARPNVADAKGRGEIRGGGKKPWRQKGTGRARHGSSRSPIWRGGGVTHGPTSERNYERKINKKMKTKALYTLLSAKLRDQEVVLLESLATEAAKTKEAKSVLDNLAPSFAKINYRMGKRALVAVPALDEKTKRSFRNLKGVAVEEIRNINPLELVNYKYLVLVNPEESLTLIKQRAK